MSHTTTADTHDHHLKEEHEKYFTFFNVSIALAIITGIELVIVYLPVNPYITFWSLAVLSLVKFLAVIWWFMHLKYDKKLCTGLFFIGLILATGTVLALMALFEQDPTSIV